MAYNSILMETIGISVMVSIVFLAGCITRRDADVCRTCVHT